MSTIQGFDPGCRMMALVVESSGVRAENAKGDLEEAHRKQDEAQAAAAEAARHAAEEREKADHTGLFGSILGDVIEVTGIVASAALAVETGGASIAAIVALTGAGFDLASLTMKKLGVGSELTNDLGALGKVAMIASPMAASVLAGAVTVAEETAAKAIAHTIAHSASVVGNVATVAKGIADKIQGNHQAAALDHEADRTQAEKTNEQMGLAQDRALGHYRHATELDTKKRAMAEGILTEEQTAHSAQVARLAGV